MGRKVQKVRYELDAKGIQNLSATEIKTILRAADPLIMSGGRAMLSKILKGSKDKKLLELGLDNTPGYGYYGQLSLAGITARVDWCVLNGYLDIEYDYRLPMLVYTPEGWEIERETYASELLAGFDKMLENSQGPYMMTYLKDRNRGMILLLLDKVEATSDPKYIPILEAWAKIDYKKVKLRISQVIQNLSQNIRPIA